MSVSQKAMGVARLNPDAWLDYTEQAIVDKKAYHNPYETKYHNRTGTKEYQFRQFAGDEKTKSINKMVVEEIVNGTNHLIDYMRVSVKKNREIPDDCVTALKKHKVFLDKYNLKKDSAGYYKIY